MTKKKNFRSRREFLRLLSILGIGGFLTACRLQAGKLMPTRQSTSFQSSTIPQNSPSPENNTATQQSTAKDTEFQTTVEDNQNPVEASSTPKANAYLSVVRGDNTEALVQTAIAALGGIERFVPNGADVIIKPNICCNYYSYEYAATTNPFVVAAIVRLCIGAGAKRVRVMDQPFGGTPASAYAKSGIADAVANAGGEMEIMNRNKFVNSEIPDGLDIREWVFYKPILDADVVIDVPIAKHHGLARLTLAGKNFLGTIATPAGIHQNFGQRIADLVSKIKPKLTVIDAVRILVDNGPTGGNLDDVKQLNTVIASHDIIAADSYAATLFGLTGADIDYVRAGASMGLGNLDLGQLNIEEISI